MPTVNRIKAAEPNFKVGDEVVVTERTLESMRSQRRCQSSAGWISDSFMAKIEPLVGVPGRILMTFGPGYPLVVDISGQQFSMRDDVIELVAH